MNNKAYFWVKNILLDWQKKYILFDKISILKVLLIICTIKITVLIWMYQGPAKLNFCTFLCIIDSWSQNWFSKIIFPRQIKWGFQKKKNDGDSIKPIFFLISYFPLFHCDLGHDIVFALLTWLLYLICWWCVELVIMMLTTLLTLKIELMLEVNWN